MAQVSERGTLQGCTEPTLAHWPAWGCSGYGMEAKGMVWYGLEANGMEWNGMEWNGMEWNGMEWNGMYGGHHP